MGLLVDIILVIFLLITIGYTYFDKNVLNPLAVFYTPLFGSYFLFELLYADEILLRLNTILSVVLGPLGFFLGFFLSIIGIGLSNKNNNYYLFRPQSVLPGIKSFFLVIGILSVVLGLPTFVSHGLGGSNSFFVNVRFAVDGNRNAYSDFTNYGSIIFFIITLLYYYEYKIEGDKRNKKLLLFFLLPMLCLATIYYMSRAVILSHFIAFIFVEHIATLKKYSRKIILKRLCIGCLIICFIFCFFAEVSGISGGKVFSTDYFLWRYWGYPILAFEREKAPYAYTTIGFSSIGSLSKLLLISGLWGERLSYSGAADEGFFNVYSYLACPYNDFGVEGCFFIMLVIGCFSGVLYGFSRKYKFFTIAYATFVYTYVMAFFAYCFSNTVNFYYIGFIFVLSLFSKKGGISKAK